MSKHVEWGLVRGFGEIICECDHCGETELIEFEDGPDFKEAQNELKNLGWIARRIDNEWYDFCQDQCFYDWIKENKQEDDELNNKDIFNALFINSQSKIDDYLKLAKELFDVYSSYIEVGFNEKQALYLTGKIIEGGLK